MAFWNKKKQLEQDTYQHPWFKEEPKTEEFIDSIETTKVMKKANQMIIQQLPHGQFIISIPRAIAEGMGWSKGDWLEFVTGDGEVCMRRVRK